MIRRQPSRKRFVAPLVVALSLTLSNCSSGSSGVHLQSIDPPSSPAASVAQSAPQSTQSSFLSVTPQSTQPAVSASLSTKPSASATKPSTPSVAPVTSTTQPWPASFSPTQQAYAKSALATFDGFVRISTAAEKQPAKDWTQAIRKYAADPTAAKTLDDLASLVAAKVHATSTETYGPSRVISATANKVVLESCVDGSQAALADDTGKKVALRSSPHPRTLLTFNVYDYSPKNGGWLVSETVAPNPVKPC